MVKEKTSYTKKEVADIAIAYHAFLNYESRHSHLIYTDTKLKSYEYKKLEKILNEIPENVRECLGISQQTIWDKLRQTGTFH